MKRRPPCQRANDRSVTLPAGSFLAEAGIAPSLARWWIGGRSLGVPALLSGSRARHIAEGLQPFPSRCWSRPSAAPAATSCQTRPQTPPLWSFLPSLRGGLGSLRRGWACGATLAGRVQIISHFSLWRLSWWVSMACFTQGPSRRRGSFSSPAQPGKARSLPEER